MESRGRGIGRIGREVFKGALCLLLAFALLVPAASAGCGKGNLSAGESAGMRVDIGKDGKTVRTGTEYYTYRVEEGFRGEVSFSLSVLSGRLDLDVYPTDRPDDAEYRGRDLCDSSFSVILTKPGEYAVRVTADGFVGDYRIGWKTEAEEAGRSA